MKPIDYVLLAGIALLAGAIVLFMVRAKKKGKKCIGCPSSGNCGKEPCAGSCVGCSGHGNCENHHES